MHLRNNLWDRAMIIPMIMLTVIRLKLKINHDGKMVRRAQQRRGKHGMIL
jgi:hypothetical protein